METRSRSSDRWLCLLGILGFASLTGALVAAHSNPATEYELSIYWATPGTFWVGVSVAFLAALLVSFITPNDRVRFGGIVLGGMASTAVVALPILRGYHFHGIHDSLTHVGWTRELASGELVPFDLLYPGVHTLGAFVNGIVGYSVWQSMLYVPVLLVLVFFVFVPLVVRELVDSDEATTIGAFSAFLLVPIHLIANTTHVHPSSQAIMFTPLLLFLLIKYVRSTDSRRRLGVLTSVGGLLLAVTTAAILYHPQQALNVILLLVAISLVQYLARKRRTLLPWSDRSHRPVYSVAGVSVLVYLGWVASFPMVFTVMEGAVASVLYFGETAPSAGSAVTSQTSALQAIGSNLVVFSVKLFFVGAVYLLLAGLVLLGALGDRFEPPDARVDTTRLITYLGVGLVAALPVFALYFFGDVSVLYFRQAGFVLMLATILGAVGISYGTGVVSKTRFSRATRLALIGSFAIMLVLSMMVVHNSPYIQRANQHVTEARVSGHDVAFQTTGDTAWIAGVRQDPERYHQALVETGDEHRLDENLNSSELHRLSQRRDGDWYLMISRNTYEREIVAYREYRFSRSDFEAIDRQPGVNLVHANGDTELYHVRGN